MYDNEPYLGGFAMYPYNNLYNKPQNIQNSIVWVQGVEGAKAYQMSPNTNMLLMDSETNGRMYIKSCDNVGMCSLRYFDYTEVDPNQKSEYVTKAELETIISELKEGLKHEQPVPATEPKYNTGKR